MLSDLEPSFMLAIPMLRNAIMLINSEIIGSPQNFPTQGFRISMQLPTDM